MTNLQLAKRILWEDTQFWISIDNGIEMKSIGRSALWEDIVEPLVKHFSSLEVAQEIVKIADYSPVMKYLHDYVAKET